MLTLVQKLYIISIIVHYLVTSFQYYIHLFLWLPDDQLIYLIQCFCVSWTESLPVHLFVRSFLLSFVSSFFFFSLSNLRFLFPSSLPPFLTPLLNSFIHVPLFPFFLPSFINLSFNFPFPFSSNSSHLRQQFSPELTKFGSLGMVCWWYQRPEMHRWIWYSNAGRVSRKIDHILVSTRWRILQNCSFRDEWGLAFVTERTTAYFILKTTTASAH